MHLTNSIFFSFFALSAAGSAHIQPRCSLLKGPEYYRGTRAIPCWFQMGPTCALHLRKEAKYSIDASRKLTTVTGISEVCADMVREENARTLDGRQTYGWIPRHGTLTLTGDSTLVISAMTEEAVKWYQSMKYLP